MTPEQLESNILEFCHEHGLRSLSISYDKFVEDSFWWRSWRGTQLAQGGDAHEMLNSLNLDPVAQKEWNEERLRAGA